MTSTLRVLLVAQPTTGGTGRCVEQLVAAGVRSGADVTVACPEDGPLAGSVAELGATVVGLELQRAPSPADTVHVSTLRRLASAFDVVHLHSSKAGAVGRLALRSMGRDRPGSVFTPHGWSWQAGGALAPSYRAFERLTARWVDAIVAVSEEERAAGQRVLGDATIEVIENGVDTERFSPDGDVAARPDGDLVVCVGRLAFPKGQEVAVAALALMTRRTARLRLVGDGPDRAAIEAQAAELGVSDRVELIGTTRDVAPHLRAADVVVVPSHSEGQSLAMLEAMACGRPVVTTDVAGSGAVRDAGAIVPVGDAAAMARAIDDLLADQARRETFGELARRRALERYDVRTMGARNKALWERVAEQRRRSAC